RADIIPVNDGAPLTLRLPLEQSSRFIDLEKEIYAFKDSVYFNPEKIITTPTALNSSGGEPPPGNYAKLTYTVKNGDNMGFISMWYNVRISDIRYWNNIRHNTIRAGQKLAIYVPRNKVERYEDINTLTFAEKQARIGKSTSVTASLDPLPVQSVTSNASSVTYTVKKGDTLWDIMKLYPGVTESEIMQWNNLPNAAKIQAGQRLKIIPKS
ncbi:LysM peptidoglycan-binding domain-containing protein, partial [bacterium]